jgi:hypothetical protein
MAYESIPLRPDGTREAGPLLEPDYTAEREKVLREMETRWGLPSFHAKLKQHIVDYRARQATGDAAPAWGRWSEFPIEVDGARIIVVYSAREYPFPAHFQFHGPITSTGFFSHHMLLDEEPADINIVSYAIEIARVKRAEAFKERKAVHRHEEESLPAPTLQPTQLGLF